MNLMLHCGAEKLSREELTKVQTPASTRTHFLIPHYKLLDATTNVLGGAGYNIVNQSHGVTKDGNRYFGLLELSPLVPEADHTFVCGLRNSHDKTFSSELVMGSGVFVCDNLAFDGEIKIARKHTRWIMRDLHSLVCRAVGRLGEFRERQEERFDNYKNLGLRDIQVHDLLIRALDAGACSASQVPKVLAEWREPTHEEFAPRTAWSLFNDFTEVYKGSSLVTVQAKSQALGGLLDSYLGIAG